MSISINGITITSIHFTGIFGSGMSAIAQFLSWQGIEVSGSDRSLNKKETLLLQEKLTDTGCSLYTQDGSYITSSKPDVLCVSTAIEADNADVIIAKKHLVPVLHRSDILAAIVKEHKTIAVAGTSGKSTVTAMIFEFLTGSGKSPSLISGAPLKRLERQNYIGNAFYGLSDLLVIEADESDGSIVKYTPYLSVVLNISKDHKPVNEITELFIKLIQNSSISFGNADDNHLCGLNFTSTFSLDSAESSFLPENYSVTNQGGLMTFNATEVHLPLPGKHNLSNCTAALMVCDHFKCQSKKLYEAVASFEGVSRRFSVTYTNCGVTIIDDFAHNPEKIHAAISAARTMSRKIIAIYQPHGFGPTNFLRYEYRDVFNASLQSGDALFLLPIYYAGGTANKNISSLTMKKDLEGAPFKVDAPEKRDDILPQLRTSANKEKCILIMGARDQSLPSYVKKITDLFND